MEEKINEPGKKYGIVALGGVFILGYYIGKLRNYEFYSKGFKDALQVVTK